MSVIESDALGRAQEFQHGGKGPVTASRHRRNAVIYALLCVAALTPAWLDASAAWQAAGLGLFLPGGGFFALGGGWLLMVPVVLALFWVSCVAWFWSGMVVAPLTVWLGSALVAGSLAGDSIWAPGMALAPMAAAGIFLWFQHKNNQRHAADRERFAMRQQFFAASRAEVVERVRSEPALGSRELDMEQLSAARYVLDRALQPVGQFKGYTVIDQFQPAALRYQINHLGFALGMMQGHYTPNFSGYLGQAQRNLVDTYLSKKVWDYWVLESMWGHFNFSNFDPAAKDNIMLTGWYGMHVNQYMLNSGDRRYAEPGSLTFRLNDTTAFPHSAHTLAQSVLDNYQHSDFFLFPCEPNWVYPVCNMYGLASLASHDAVFGTTYAQNSLPKWMDMLESEFMDEKGSIIGLRSYWTGLEVPFYAGEAGFAFFANCFSPALARRLWAIGRKELAFCIAPDANGQPRLSIPREALSWLDTIDPGHYKPGALFAYAAVAMSAREFGDDELAEAALRSMDQDCGRFDDNGAVGYREASCLANVWAVEAKLMRTGDFRNSFVKGPAASAFTGPQLAEASYPEVLVAKATSTGADLDLVLYPGRGNGRQKLGLARLAPGASYRVAGRPDLDFRADDAGTARLEVELNGRTALNITPA
ncbi:MAG: hypothetical protein IPM80_04140 [Proteobacteria bacterium]|nr:hypothetical protein [Pseudomonadota bacterium]